MFKALVNYNHTPDKDWLGDDYLIYDRSDSEEYLKDFPQDKIIYTPNVGQVDFDKLSYLIDNYDTLPDVFLWCKTNLFKYITEEEYALVKNNTVFTPLLKQNHNTYTDKYGLVCYYQGGMYYERNDSWYLNVLDSRVKSWGEWAQIFALPNPTFIPFAPGGNYILTRETIHKYGRDFYESMRDLLPYCQNPGEAHLAERSYYLMWA